MTDFAPVENRLCNLTVGEFLSALASGTPTPGGGSATALAGALGGALVTMVVRLTIGRERYADVQAEIIGLQNQAEALQHNLVELMDADARAYGELMAAYRLPGCTDDEKAHRSAAIQAALRDATEVPLAVAAACADILELAAQVAAHGNANAAADAAVGALLAQAGLHGAVHNVRSNLRCIANEAFRNAAHLRATQLLTIGNAGLAATLTAADERG
jgi:formiminotetrahydrofolate cyclodeaminase